MPDRNVKLLFALFALSGFTGLIYESVWSHYLKLFLGAAAFAQSFVLAGESDETIQETIRASPWSTRLTIQVAAYGWIGAAIGRPSASRPRSIRTPSRCRSDQVLPALGSPGT